MEFFCCYLPFAITHKCYILKELLLFSLIKKNLEWNIFFLYSLLWYNFSKLRPFQIDWKYVWRNQHPNDSARLLQYWTQSFRVRVSQIKYSNVFVNNKRILMERKREREREPFTLQAKNSFNILLELSMDRNMKPIRNLSMLNKTMRIKSFKTRIYSMWTSVCSSTVQKCTLWPAQFTSKLKWLWVSGHWFSYLPSKV